MIFTVKKLRIYDYLILLASILFIGLVVYLPGVCAKGGKEGLHLSAKVIIPSLFPFAVAVLYLMNSPVFKNTKRPVLVVYLLSLIGGYPIGGKLLGELSESGRISKSDAEKYLPFCVNAGPAFILLAVGKGILGSIKTGYILLAAHLLSSILITLLFAPKILTGVTRTQNTPKIKNAGFAESVKNASGTTLNICAFVVFFSVINAYLVHFSSSLKRIKYLVFITEVTNAVSRTNNVYFISFLLGFAGISIWVQIFSVSGNLRTSILKFVLFRLLHGVFSAAICVLLFKIFRVSTPVISNGQAFGLNVFYSNSALAFSLLIMVLLLLINITAKKHTGNLLNDVL